MWYCGTAQRGQVYTFNCLSSAKAQAANFPFCTIEPNVGVITVPDERLTKLAEIVHPVAHGTPHAKLSILRDLLRARQRRGTGQ